MARDKDNSEKQFETKAERARYYREQRLDAITADDGTKKPVVKKHTGRNILLVVLGVLVILALVFFIMWQSGSIQRNLTALRISDTDISINEYNYNYKTLSNMYEQYYGQGAKLDLNADSSAVTNQDLTWGEFFDKSAKESLQEQTILYENAIAEGYELDQADKNSIAVYVNNMKNNIGNQADLEFYLKNLYGKGMNLETLEDILGKSIIAEKYYKNKPDEFKVEDSAIESYYDTNKDAFDMVDYFTIKLEVEKGKDEKEVSADAKKQAEETAKKMVEELALSGYDYYHSEHPENEELDGKKIEYHYNVRQANVGNQEIAKWLFNEDKETDAKYFDGTDEYTVVGFIDRAKDHRNIADVRLASFGLTDPEGKMRTDEEIDKMREKAELMQGTIKKPEDFDHFDKEEKQSTDASVSSTYDKVSGINHANLDQKVLAWVLDKDTKTGDTEIIETDKRIYVVHLSKKYDQPSYTKEIESVLQSEKFTDKLDEHKKEDKYKVEEVRPGYWWTV